MRVPSVLSGRTPLVVALGAGLLVIALLALVQPRIGYAIVTSFVVVDDRLEPADFIYVLNGSIAPRVAQTARLYQDGLAPRVLLAHTRERARAPHGSLSKLIASEIAGLGVPRDALEIVPFENGVVNTRDEARALRQYLERRPAEHVIVVTMDYHTGRSLRTLRQELRGLDVELSMAPARSSGTVTRDNWWESTDGRRIYLTEFWKGLATIVLGLSPIR